MGSGLYLLCYGRNEMMHVMHDTVELSFSTAKKAHAIVLQQMEKGKCTWSHPDQIEKLRARYTQRAGFSQETARKSTSIDKRFTI